MFGLMFRRLRDFRNTPRACDPLLGAVDNKVLTGFIKHGGGAESGHVGASEGLDAIGRTQTLTTTATPLRELQRPQEALTEY